MKKQLRFFALIFISFVTSVLYAQNPKTNSGNLNNKPQQVYPTATPPITIQSCKKDSNQTLVDSNFTKKDTTNKPIDYSNYRLLSLGIIVGISQNEYRKVSDGDVGIGFGLTLMHNFLGNNKKEKNPVNFYLGGTFEYLYFGGKSNTNSYSYYDNFSRFDNTATTSVNLNVYTLMIASRIEFFNGPIIPFFEVAAGGRWFDGTQKISVTQTETDYLGHVYAPVEKSFSNSLESTITGCYGYGGGLKFGNSTISLELKLMNYRGTTATYVDNESIKIDPVTNQVTFQTKTSTTDLLIPQISISGTF